MAERDHVTDEPPAMPTPRKFDEGGDATRRTWLASERTVLAWLRTGLTATAVAVGVGKVVPDLRSGGSKWPFVAIGVGYAILGVAVVVFGVYRGQQVDRAIREGRWIGPSDRAMGAVGGIAALLALMTVVVLIADA